MLPRIQPTNSTRTTTGASLSTLRQNRTHALIRAVGEWDLANAHALGELLEQHHKAGRRFVRLDVSAVSFLDCTCLGVLVTAHQRLRAARGRLVLTGVTPRTRRLLRLAGLDRALITTSPKQPRRPIQPPSRRLASEQAATDQADGLTINRTRAAGGTVRRRPVHIPNRRAPP
jgi:anti-sigma B factor antagonist